MNQPIQPSGAVIRENAEGECFGGLSIKDLPSGLSGFVHPYFKDNSVRGGEYVRKEEQNTERRYEPLVGGNPDVQNESETESLPLFVFGEPAGFVHPYLKK